jgi:hypothetical protein
MSGVSLVRPFPRLQGGAFVLLVALLPACGGDAGDRSAVAASANVHDDFLANLGAQCGQAFAGRVAAAPEGDAYFSVDQELVLQFRECAPDRVKVPVHAGDNASRTWIFSRTGGGVDLRHDHRHADGRSEPNTFYGAFVADVPIAEESPSAGRHEFKRVREGVRTGWVVEIIPGERYTYGTQRDGVWRHRFDFDLTSPVDAPRDPWGHPPVGEAAPLAEPQAAFMRNLAQHCGNAYNGQISRRPETDQLFRGDEVLTVHFRGCAQNELELPFHVEENRSRTWILTATTAGIDLRHDHRHEDGSPEENTWYGAHTQAVNTANRQEFLREGDDDGVVSGWAIEIVPGERYTYGTIRDGDWNYRLDFDLTTPVEAPPAPWGH